MKRQNNAITQTVMVTVRLRHRTQNMMADVQSSPWVFLLPAGSAQDHAHSAANGKRRPGKGLVNVKYLKKFMAYLTNVPNRCSLTRINF